MISKDLVIVGGGAGGLSAAISAYNNGIKDIFLVISLNDNKTIESIISFNKNTSL